MKSLGIAGFIISSVILSYLLYTAGIGELMRIYNTASKGYVAFAVILYFFSSLLHAFRWNQFIRSMKM